MGARRVPGTIDVAEGAIAHLLEQDPAFQAGIFGHLRGSFPLLGDDLLDFGLAGPASRLAIGGRRALGVVCMTVAVLGIEGGVEIPCGRR